MRQAGPGLDRRAVRRFRQGRGRAHRPGPLLSFQRIGPGNNQVLAGRGLVPVFGYLGLAVTFPACCRITVTSHHLYLPLRQTAAAIGAVENSNSDHASLNLISTSGRRGRS